MKLFSADFSQVFLQLAFRRADFGRGSYEWSLEPAGNNRVRFVIAGTSSTQTIICPEPLENGAWNTVEAEVDPAAGILRLNGTDIFPPN